MPDWGDLGRFAYFRTHPLPVADDFLCFDLSDPEAVRRLGAHYGYHVDLCGGRNFLLVHRQAAPAPGPGRLVVYGIDNLLVIDRDCTWTGQMVFYGSRNLAFLFGGQTSQLLLDAFLYEGDTLIWGRGSICWQARIWVLGGVTVSIGDGCLFSDGISLRSSDHHAIIDLASGEEINPPAPITLEDRVWVGQDVRIGKGVTVGAGAILGSGAQVTRSVPPLEAWAGNPARKLRGQVGWTRDQPASSEQRAALDAWVRRMDTRDPEPVASAGRAADADDMAWLARLELERSEMPGWWSLLPAAMRRRRELARLCEAGVFDGAAYLARNPDVRAAGQDPLCHYLRHGMAEGRGRQ